MPRQKNRKNNDVLLAAYDYRTLCQNNIREKEIDTEAKEIFLGFDHTWTIEADASGANKPQIRRSMRTSQA